MATAHLYLFSDACPTDWLVDGEDDTWHTIVNFAFQSDPQLFSDIEGGLPHEEVLKRDPLYEGFVTQMRSSSLPSMQLRKWDTSISHRNRFCKSFTAILRNYKPLVAALSFQQKTLQKSKLALFNSYNSHIGEIEGQGIGFEEYFDSKSRLRLKHSFLNFHGHHEIEGLERQMVILLLMAFFVADQFRFYYQDLVKSGRYGFDKLLLTVVSDRLSGDGDDRFRRKSEQNLRHLIDPDGDGAFVRLTRSNQIDVFSGDLIADNLAGWLNAAIRDPTGCFAEYVRQAAPSGVWTGWHTLRPSVEKLESISAMQLLRG
ncbi:MAG: hypothetical protein JF626_10460 [Polaromonas sp.]|nr:hypothetical protein [Polaromonas sp.]